MSDRDDETRLKAWSAYQRTQRLRVTIAVVVFIAALVGLAIVSLT